MATLTVWKFNDADGAEQAAAKVAEAEKVELLEVQDGAIVSWPQGKKRPRTKQATNLTAAGALDGSFWGLLFGVLFFMPLIGMAIGAVTGALGGALSDYGISDDFIKRVRGEVTEGTSALFLLSRNEKVERLQEIFADATLIESNLTDDELDSLKDGFAEA